MTNDVDIKFTPDDQEYLRSLQKQVRQLEKQVEKMNQVGRAGRKAGQDAKVSLNSATQSVGRFIAAATGIGSVVGGFLALANQLRREYDNLVQKQKAAANTQVDFASAINTAAFNSKLSPKELEQRVLKIAQQTGVDQTTLAVAAGSALSAKGPKNKREADEALGAVKAAAELAPQFSQEELAILAGAGIDLSGQLGISVKQSLGALLKTGGQSRVTALGKLAKNAVPAIIGAGQFGGDFEENAALFALLSNKTVDSEGATTRTNLIALAKQLEERLPQFEDTKARLEFLNDRPELRNAFFGGGKFGETKFAAASFEKAGFAAIRQLVRGDFRDELNNTVRAIGSPTAGGAEFERFKREQLQTTSSQTAFIDRTLKTTQKGIQIADVAGGRAGAIRENLTNIIQATGRSDLEKRLSAFNFERNSNFGRGDSVGELSRLINSLIYKLENPTTLRFEETIYGPEYRQVARSPSQEELGGAENLKALIIQIQRVADEIEKSNTTNAPPKKVKPPTAALSE